MSAVIIGRVAVKVLPDTNDFRRDAQRKLDAIEKRIEVSIKTKADLTGAELDLLQGVRDINAKNRRSDARKIRLWTKLDLNSRNMRTELSQARRKYEAMSKTDKVKLGTTLTAADVTLELDQDNLRKVKEDIDHWRRANSPVKLPVHLDLNNPLARLTEGRIEILTRPRTVNIIPKVNEFALAKARATLAALSGGRVLRKFFGEFSEWIGNLDRALPKLAAVGLGIVAIGAAGLTSAANLFALSSSLASIGGVALGLPGILGGFAIGITATIVALKDFKKRVPEVSAAWKQIKKTIQDNFWSKAQKPIREMIDGLLPEFTSGFGKASTQIGGFFGNLASSLKTSLKPALKGMFADLSKSIKIFGGHTKSMAGIITTLGKVGAHLLPRMAKYFGGVSDRMDAFLKKAAKDGTLDRWINNGINALKDLGRVFKNIYGIFHGFNDAMKQAGGSTLHTFAGTLERINKTVNSAGFQQGLVRAFSAAGVAMHEIATEAGPAIGKMFTNLSKAFTTLLPTVGKTVGKALDAIASVLGNPKFLAGVQQFFNGVQKAVDSLAPTIKTLAGPLGEFMSLAGRFIAQIGPLFASVISVMATAFHNLEPGIKTAMDMLTGITQSIINVVGPAIESITKHLGGIAVPALAAVGALALVAKTALIVAGTGKAMLLWADAALLSVVRVGRGFRDVQYGMSSFSGTAGTIGAKIRGFFTAIGTAAVSMARYIGTAFRTAGTALAGIPAASAAASGFAGKVGAVGKGVGGAVKALGPMTLGIAGVTAVLGVATWAWQKHEAEQALAKQRVEDLTAAIREDNGALGENTRAVIANKLEQDGGLATAQKYGISLKDVTSAAMGNAAAHERVNAQIDALTNKTLDGGAIEGLSGLRTGIDNLAGSTDQASGKFGRVTAAIGSMKTQTDSAVTSTDTLRTALNNVDGGAISAEQAYISVKQAVNDLTTKVKVNGQMVLQNGTALIGNSKAALANRAALLGVMQMVKAHGQAMVDQGKTATQVKGALDADVNSLIAQARQAGFSEKSLRTLLTAMGLMPNAAAKTAKATGTVGVDAAHRFSEGVLAQANGVKQSGAKVGSSAGQGLGEGISKEQTQVQGKVQSLASAISSSGVSWSSLLYGAGQSVINGLSAGIASATPRVKAQLNDLTAQIPNWKGPKETDKKLLVATGQYIIDGLVRGIGSRVDDVRQKLKDLTAIVGRGFDSGVRKMVDAQETRVNSLLSDFATIHTAVEAARQNIADLDKQWQDYFNTIRSGVIETGNVTGIEATDFAGIVKGLTTAAASATEFATLMSSLKAMGLNGTTLDQIAQAGVTKGSVTAKALLSGGRAGITQINSLAANIAKSATSAASTAANGMYQSGIAAADGFLAGLRSKQDSIIKQMTSISKAMVDSIKKALGIHSPSRVFAWVGQMTGAGLLSGLESQYDTVLRSLRGFARNVAGTDFGDPTINVGARLNTLASSAYGTSAAATAEQAPKTFNYYAAPGRSLSSQEELFAASERARFAW